MKAATSLAEEDLAWAPAWQIKGLFEEKALSPLEYAEAILKRCDQYGHYGAFISVFPEHLLEQAKAATERYARGEQAGLLDGLPVSVKDTIFTKGQRTTLGSRAFADLVPDTDSVASERVKAEGGIIFAKSNTPEFALNRRSVNLVSREAVNPWDARRTSGGSSGGAGVAAAAGLGPLAVGTDGGGSIRIPSAFNGVFGVLASRGRVPNGAGLYHAPTSGIGPMTRDVRDAATLFQAMACCDERDPRTMRVAPPDYLAELEHGVAGLRMGWSWDLGHVEPDIPEIPELVHEVAQSFVGMGAVYSELDIKLEDPHDLLDPDTEYSRIDIDRWFRTLVPDYKNMMHWALTLPPEKKELLSVYITDRTDRPTILEYTMSIRPEVRYRSKTRLADLFSQIDILMAPVIARPAFLCGDEHVTPWQYTAYTMLANSSGYCACSVPAGFYNGMPIGLQLMAPPNKENLLFRAARALERERPWAQHRPPLMPASSRG
ncbi:MAG: amidase [Sphingobium sp.]